jgi:hypothetical protein
MNLKILDLIENYYNFGLSLFSIQGHLDFKI